MKLTKICILLILMSLMSGCDLSKQISGKNQGKPSFFIDNLKFEDYSIEQVYVVFDLYNNINESGTCSVRITLSQKDEVVLQNEYEIGEVEENSVENNRILVDMPLGKTDVNVEPLCVINVGEEQDEGNRFILEDLELRGDSGISFNIYNKLNGQINCSGKVVMYKNNILIFEKINYLGTIEGDSNKYYEIPLGRSMPSGKTVVDVIPSCRTLKESLVEDKVGGLKPTKVDSVGQSANYPKFEIFAYVGKQNSSR